MASSGSIAAPPVHRQAPDVETRKPRDRAYRQDIDGLRAIAILSVVLYHAAVPFVPGGFTGVDIFFAISGYLIGGHIFSELRGGTFSYLRFYQRRAKRILPAYFFVISFTVVAALLLLSPFEAWQLARAAFASTLSVSNILFWHTAGYFDTRSELNALLMTWSLGVEEQFYLVVPLLMVLVGRFRRNLLLPAIGIVCAVSLAYAMLALRTQPGLVFFTLPPRAWELGLGVGLAIVQQTWQARSVPRPVVEAAGAVGIALVLLPMYLLTNATPFPGAAALPSVLGAVLLLASAGSWVNRTALSLAPLTFVGRISYSFYLWHWPLLAFARLICGRTLPPLVTAIIVAVSFGAAILSYYFIEQPFRNSRRAPAPLLKRYGWVMAGVLAVCAVVWFSRGIRARNPELAHTEDEALVLQDNPCLLLYGEDTPNLSPGCYRVTADRPALVVWGDSHSAALSPALRSAAESAGMGFALLSKASCPPLTGATRFLPAHVPVAAECQAFNRKVLKVIESTPSIKVVALAGFWAAPLQRNNEDGWLTVDLADERRVPSLEEAAGKRVIVFGDVPNFDLNPVFIVRTGRIPARRLLYRILTGHPFEDTGLAPPSSVSTDPETDALLRASVGNLPGVDIVDLKPALCTGPEACLYRNGNVLFYGDPQHLSAAGARYALQKSSFSLPAVTESTKQ
jgi:peptidoglycan/LPS O-acetylase OafA/YrhL